MGSEDNANAYLYSGSMEFRKTENLIIYQKPEKRKFNYSPRFYNPDEATKDKKENFDIQRFGERLHRSWSKKRQLNKKTHSSANRIVWLMFIFLVLLFLTYKFII